MSGRYIYHWKERATYSANTLIIIINDVLPLYLGMNVRHIYLTRILGKFTTASAPGVAQLVNTVIPAFIALLTGEFFTCCKRICWGSSMISFLLELA